MKPVRDVDPPFTDELQRGDLVSFSQGATNWSGDEGDIGAPVPLAIGTVCSTNAGPDGDQIDVHCPAMCAAMRRHFDRDDLTFVARPHIADGDEVILLHDTANLKVGAMGVCVSVKKGHFTFDGDGRDYQLPIRMVARASAH